MNIGARGIALPLVLFALGLTGVLVAGLTWVGLTEVRAGRAMLRLLQAQAMAETGAYRVIGAGAVAGAGPVGGGEPAAGTYMAEVIPLGPGLAAVRATGTAPGGQARREVVVLIDVDLSGIAAAAAPQPLPDRSWIQRR